MHFVFFYRIHSTRCSIIISFTIQVAAGIEKEAGLYR